MNSTTQRRPEWAVIFPNNLHRKAVPFGRADTAEKFARSTVHGIAVPVYPGPGPGPGYFHRDSSSPVEFVAPNDRKGGHK